MQDYFSKFGEVLNITVPKPFRGFAFVSFLDPDVAYNLCGEDHIIKNVSVHLSNAIPKQDNVRGPFGRGPGRYEDNSWNNRGSSSHRSWGEGSSGEGRNWGYNNAGSSNSRSNDIPNMASLGSSLGINPIGSNNNPNHMGGGSGGNNNSNPANVNISLTPALVAAALNQAGWGLLNNLQNAPQGQGNMGSNQSALEGGMSSSQAGFSGNQPGGSGGGWMKNYGMSP